MLLNKNQITEIATESKTNETRKFTSISFNLKNMFYYFHDQNNFPLLPSPLTSFPFACKFVSDRALGSLDTSTFQSKIESPVHSFLLKT